MTEPEVTRLTITWSKDTDLALRDLLPAQGRDEGDLSKFVEDAVRWRIFHETIETTRAAFASVSEEELQKQIDDAVEAVRAERYPERVSRS